jgi:hypothetical protein
MITNPFMEISSLIPDIAMQIYVIAMFLLVVGGTLLDMYHKKSSKYFFENSETAKKIATRQVGAGEKASLAIKTVTNEVLTSGEFSNPKRRISHLFSMYGFIIFVVTTAIMIFSLDSTATDTASTSAMLPILWHVGALMLCFGGYWFWFFIRVDVSAEGYPWYRLVRADMFIVSLLATATFALIWSLLQQSLGVNNVWSILAFVLFISASTFLFSTVLWSKFAHMFFKPAAAFQKRVTKADGSREKLPEITDKTRDSLVELKDAPVDMGLGIKREAPHHY